MIKRRKWNVAHVDGKRNSYRILEGNLKYRTHLENLGIDGSIILKWLLNKQDDRV